MQLRVKLVNCSQSHSWQFYVCISLRFLTFIILYRVGLRTILRLFLLCIVWLRLSTIMIKRKWWWWWWCIVNASNSHLSCFRQSATPSCQPRPVLGPTLAPSAWTVVSPCTVTEITARGSNSLCHYGTVQWHYILVCKSLGLSQWSLVAAVTYLIVVWKLEVCFCSLFSVE